MNRDDIDCKSPQRNYREVKRALAGLEPFTHGESMAGGWDETHTTYYVFSYRTVIAWVNIYGEHWFNLERYSVTTSKQQGYVAWYLRTDI